MRRGRGRNEEDDDKSTRGGCTGTGPRPVPLGAATTCSSRPLPDGTLAFAGVASSAPIEACWRRTRPVLSYLLGGHCVVLPLERVPQPGFHPVEPGGRLCCPRFVRLRWVLAKEKATWSGKFNNFFFLNKRDVGGSAQQSDPSCTASLQCHVRLLEKNYQPGSTDTPSCHLCALWISISWRDGFRATRVPRNAAESDTFISQLPQGVKLRQKEQVQQFEATVHSSRPISLPGGPLEEQTRGQVHSWAKPDPAVASSRPGHFAAPCIPYLPSVLVCKLTSQRRLLPLP